MKPLVSLLKRLSAAANLLPCPLCGKGDGHGVNDFCPECRAEIPFFHGRRCRGCGGEFDGVLAICSKCLREPPRCWSDAYSVMAYQGIGAELIARFKSADTPELARPFAALAAEFLSDPERCHWEYDLIVPMPLHWRRYLRRSYNQAELLAGAIAALTGKPQLQLLRRTRAGRLQKSLNREERHRHLKGLFQTISPEKIRGRRILLVDDVLTTGATMNAAASALKEAGAAEIFILTIARA